MSNLRRILLVEDNSFDLELTLDALSEYRLANDIDVVRDGADALDYLYCRGEFSHRTPYNPMVIILDLKLPRINGLEVLRTIKSDARLKTIPTVILTSSAEDKDIVEGYRLGVNAYVVKPVHFPDFSKAIKELGYFWAVVNKAPS